MTKLKQIQVVILLYNGCFSIHFVMIIDMYWNLDKLFLTSTICLCTVQNIFFSIENNMYKFKWTWIQSLVLVVTFKLLYQVYTIGTFCIKQRNIYKISVASRHKGHINLHYIIFHRLQIGFWFVNFHCLQCIIIWVNNCVR